MEVWELILGHLAQEEWLVARQVCRAWREIIQDLPFHFTNQSRAYLKIFRVVSVCTDDELVSRDLPSTLQSLDGRRQKQPLIYPLSLSALTYPRSVQSIGTFQNLTSSHDLDWRREYSRFLPI